MAPTFRLARDDEDETLGRLIHNAFLFNWDINWWQNLRAPLRSVSASPAHQESMTATEKARLAFYRSAIRMVRIAGGEIAVAVPSEKSSPAAVLCWLPPHTGLSLWTILRSGIPWALLRFGLRGAYRFLFFEHALDGLYARVLPPLGYRGKFDGAFVQVVATDPRFSGKRYGSELLEWQIQRHMEDFPNAPVFLDTANEYSVKVYERIGFREIGREKLSIRSHDIMEQHRQLDHVLVAMMLDTRETQM